MSHILKYMSSILATRSQSVTADTLIKSGGGYLKHIVATNVTVAGTLTVYDSTTETGTIIQSVTLAISNAPVVIPVEGQFSTGCFVGFDATLVGRVTVSVA